MIKTIDDIEPIKREHVVSICSLVNCFKPDAQLFVFGSYAKGCVKKDSDLDLLMLINEDLDQKELRRLKYEIYDYIEEKLKYLPDLDIKLYYKNKFYESAKELGFESSISTYMIPYGGEVGGN